MNNAAGFPLKLYNKEEALQIFRFREQLRAHKLTPESINIWLARISQDEEKEYLTKIKREPIGFLNLLEGVEQWLGGKEVNPSNAKTVAYMMLQTGAYPLMLQALQNFKIGKVNTFITYYDYVEGMMEVISAVIGAINVLEGNGEKVADEASIRWLQERKVMPAGVMEILHKAHSAEYEYFAKILEKDSTGIEVVNEMVAELEEEMWFKQSNPEGVFSYPRILPYQYLKLYIAGARFGQKIYESLYELWEREKCSSN